MATKSFVTEFKLNAKSGHKLLKAIENSRKIERPISQKVSDVTKPQDIDRIMSSFLGE